MNGSAYYNENDPFAAGWLRNLIRAGHIAPGEVDERSIVNVRPDDLRGFSQCHFFAGIGGWSVALRLAGWPDDRPVWTGSCPCQPFSAAGAGKAADDERHLWPAWLPLIAERRPATVFGEQVEAAIGWGWLDAVFADLEEQGYACGATILPACGVGAPHIRQRCWFVADSGSERRQQIGRGTSRDESEDGRRPQGNHFASGDGEDGELADASSGGQREFGDASRPGRGGHVNGSVVVGELGDTLGPRLEGLAGHVDDGREPGREREDANGSTSEASTHGGVADPSNGRRKLSSRRQGVSGEEASRVALSELGVERDAGFWTGADWLPCTDGKARPVRPRSFPLAHGVQRRTSKLRAYGNAIVPQVAAEFIGAFREAIGEA